MEIRDHINNIRTIAASSKPAAPAEEDKVAVSSATRRIAFAYERFRNVLEPDEADILRRKAIYRMLERRLVEDRSQTVTATLLLQELIRANYIDPVPVSGVAPVALIIERTNTVWHQLPEAAAEIFLRIAAVALDRHLFPRHAAEATVNQMYHDVSGRIVWADDLVPETDRLSQLFIACHRTLFAADDYELFYHFFINQYPGFFTGHYTGEMSHLISELPPYLAALKNQVYHDARERLYRILRPSAVPYRIILDLIEMKKDDIWQDEDALKTASRSAIEKRIHHIQTRLTRRAWHSILFLFFTKSLVAIFLELPYELILLGGAHWLALGANIVFHPLLLFFASTTVRMPGESNTARITDHVLRIATLDGIMPNVVVQKARRYGAITWSLFATFYTILFLFIFWRLFVFLGALQFSILGILIFVVFLGLVSFLATRIRRSVDDIRVIPKREGLLGTLFSFLSLPILEFGRFLTAHISQLNVFLFVMDLILEAPFKVLIDVFEEWFTFIRDRKEEIV